MARKHLRKPFRTWRILELKFTFADELLGQHRRRNLTALWDSRKKLFDVLRSQIRSNLPVVMFSSFSDHSCLPLSIHNDSQFSLSNLSCLKAREATWQIINPSKAKANGLSGRNSARDRADKFCRRRQLLKFIKLICWESLGLLSTSFIWNIGHELQSVGLQLFHSSWQPFSQGLYVRKICNEA